MSDKSLKGGEKIKFSITLESLSGTESRVGKVARKKNAMGNVTLMPEPTRAKKKKKKKHPYFCLPAQPVPVPQ